MPKFVVNWFTTIDNPEITTPLQAAERAWKNTRNDGSTANVFRVMDAAGKLEEVDLCHAYGPDGRPEDLADLAPELLAVLEEITGTVGSGHYTPYEVLVRARRAIVRAKGVTNA